MRLKCCSASKLSLLIIAVAFIGAVCGGEARAQGGLSLGVRVQQEFYTPLVPVTRNFRTCFTTDAHGEQVLGVCTEPDKAREPASAPRAADQGVPTAMPSPRQKSQSPQSAPSRPSK